MKSLSIKSKILAAVAVVLCLVIVAASVQMAVAITGANHSDYTPPDDDLSTYDVVFSGNITLLEEPYDVTLKGKDGEFTVDANMMKDIIGGTYTFTEGQGWTFAFNDSLGTNIRSQYDKVSKTHSFVYSLDLGARSVGNIMFSNEDADFVASDTPWEDIPTFSGTADFGGISATMKMVCKADGTFNLFSTDLGQYVSAQAGTYEFKDGIYVFRVTDSDKEYVSELKDGIQVVTVLLDLPVMGLSEIPTEITQTILTADE